MDCEQLKTDLAAEMLAGRDEPGHAMVAAHIGECRSCRQEGEELQCVIDLLSAVAPHEVDGVPVPDPERAIATVRRRRAVRLASLN